jgi:hypothetical protein
VSRVSILRSLTSSSTNGRAATPMDPCTGELRVIRSGRRIIPKIMQTALYFEAVNFASSIKARALVALGFVDTVAPPVGIWIAFDQIKWPKEAAPMIDSPHNNMATPAQQRPYTSRSAAWLNALVHGEEIKPSLELMSDQNDQGAKNTPSPRMT